MAKLSDTREKLLETAIELVWQSNYGNVGVNEICERAGVTKGSFYYHFESKAALFRAASEHSWQKIKLELDAILSPENDALTKLEGWIDLIIEDQGHDDNQVSGCPFFTSGAQCGNEEPVVRQVAIDMAGRCLVYCSALVRSLQQEGCLEDDDTDAGQIARLLMHYIQGVLLYGKVLQSLDAIIEDLRPGIYRLIRLKPTLWRSFLRKTPATLKTTAA